MSQEHPIDQTSFAEKLQFLFSVVRSPSRHLYNVSEVTEAINADGYVLSRAYLSSLREGTRPMPKRPIVEALAKFFNVPVAYFYDEEVFQWTKERVGLLVSLRDAQVQSISTHAVGLDADSLRVIYETVQQFRRANGLPTSPGDQQIPTRKRRKRGQSGFQPPEEGTPADR